MNTASATAEHTKTMVMISLMAAVICILGPLSLAIPISPVPVSLTNLAVYLCSWHKERHYQLPDLSPDRAHWHPGLLRIHRRTGKASRAYRRLSDRLHFHGTLIRPVY